MEDSRLAIFNQYTDVAVNSKAVRSATWGLFRALKTVDLEVTEDLLEIDILIIGHEAKSVAHEGEVSFRYSKREKSIKAKVIFSRKYFGRRNRLHRDFEFNAVKKGIVFLFLSGFERCLRKHELDREGMILQRIASKLDEFVETFDQNESLW